MKGDPRVLKALNELLEQILADEETHMDWIEAQLHLIQEVGQENYLAQQIYSAGGGEGRGA